MGWLHAIPEGRRKSRAKALQEADAESNTLVLPDIGDGAYVIGMLQEAGLASSSGMGPTPLTWQEIEAWQRVTDSKPSLWDRLMIKELSEAYVAELTQATDLNRPDPYVHVDIEIERAVVVDKWKSFLAMRKKSRIEQE